MTVTFSDSKAKPGSNISINLQAAPGSRFALSAVDKSVQLLGSTSDLKPGKVRNLLLLMSVRKLYGYLLKDSKIMDKYFDTNTHSY